MTIRCQWLERADQGAAVAGQAQAAALGVAVIDTGIGIAPEDQTAIWEEFRQIPAVAQQVGALPGTGLGLALTRQLVQHMGGVVWLESKLGKGSTFTFLLPRKSSEPVADHALRDGSAETCNDSTTPLALVIEDYPATHKLLVDWLNEAGLATASAYDGEDGLQKARQLHPRLIVLDLQLPRLDGWQVLTALKQDAATTSIPVVIVTVRGEQEPPSGLAVQGFFIKPLSREDFSQTVRSLTVAVPPASEPRP